MNIFGLVIMTEKKYNAIRQAQTDKILELMTKNGALEFDKKHLQDMLRCREEYIDNLLESKIPIYE